MLRKPRKFSIKQYNSYEISSNSLWKKHHQSYLKFLSAASYKSLLPVKTKDNEKNFFIPCDSSNNFLKCYPPFSFLKLPISCYR